MDKNVQFIIKTLNDNNYEAFIVGGCVRDILLNRVPKDFDVTTSATPLEIKKCFKKTFDTGIIHGTVTVVLNCVNYEVTTYRIDGDYNDCRHPDKVVFTKNLEEDLLRRDFTMNAIAYHEKIGFIDPFDGKKDISQKIIRGVGEPNKRFQEDALRMMRAIRFSAQLGFEIEPKTLDALFKNNYLIQNISIERIRDEFFKILLSDNIQMLNLLSQSKLLKFVNESFDCYLLENKDFIIKSISISDSNILIRLTLFFQFVTYDKIEDVLKFLKMDNKNIHDIKILLNYINTPLTNEKYFIKKYKQKLPLN